MAEAPTLLRTLKVPLTRKECLRRLEVLVGAPPGAMPDAGAVQRGREFVGQVSESRVQLQRAACRLGAFRPTLVGMLHEAGRGTELRYRIGLAPRTSILMAVWFGGVAAFLGAMVLLLQFGTGLTVPERGRLLEGIALCCACGALGAGVLLVAKLKAPEEGDLLERAIRRALGESR